MRRSKPEPREVAPDVRYNSVPVSYFIHRIMKRGKKSVATTIMYDAMEIVKEKTGKSPVEVMEIALKNVGPVMEVKPPCWWRDLSGADGSCPGTTHYFSDALDHCGFTRPFRQVFL